MTEAVVNFISLCSGIEAASVAFAPLGWKAVAFAEIEPFPCAVLAHRYPGVPNYGDMTKFRDWPEEVFIRADAIVGGPPCQAFSVAGLRASLSDDRGNLTLIYVELLNHADRIRLRHGKPPVVALYENVPGILSTSDNAFGCFLGALAGADSSIVPPPAVGWTDAGVVAGPQRTAAWRTLDAQFFRLAQRRRRVFVVGSARAGFDPAKVLFEWEGVRRDLAPSRQARQGVATGADDRADGRSVAGTLSARTDGGGGLGTDFELGGGLVPETSLALTAARGQACSNAADLETFLPHPVCMAHGQGNAEILSNGGAPTLTCNHEAPIVAMPTADIVGTITSAGGHAVPGNTVQDAVAHQLIPMRAAVGTDMYNGRVTGDVAATLSSQSGDGVSAGPSVLVPVMVFKPSHFTRDKDGAPSDLCPPLSADADKGDQDPLVLAPTIFTGDGVVADPVSASEGKTYTHEGANFRLHDCVGVVEPLPFDTTQVTSGANFSNPKPGDACHPLAAGAHAPAIAFQERGRADGRNLEHQVDVAYALTAPSGGGRAQERCIAFSAKDHGGNAHLVPAVQSAMQVRRLTPRECERLQGFQWQCAPDYPGAWQDAGGQWWSPDYTQIPWRGKPTAECPDGPRYKALGNSWAVPVAAWVGRRIQEELNGCG